MSNGGSRLSDFESRLSSLKGEMEAGLAERARAIRAAAGRVEEGDAVALLELARLTHRLKGVAGTHGHEELGAAAAALEEAARTGRTGEVGALADRVVDLARRIRPAAAPEAPAEEPAATPDRPWALVIDDDDDARKLVSLILARMGGFEVCSLPTATEGLAWLEGRSCAVVVVDAMMHGMDGLQFCRALHARDGEARPPILMLSAASAEELGWETAARGPDAWLMKPVAPQQLLARIGELRGRRE